MRKVPRLSISTAHLDPAWTWTSEPTLPNGWGVRVIAFDRPGYGRSDPASCSLELVARDVEAIVDRLGVGRFATLG